MKELFAYLALGAVGLWAITRKSGKAVGRMSDTPVSLENVRKGVARGWYTAQLCKVDGKPAVKLSGTANGKPYSDYYPVTQATWNALKADGVQQIGRVCGVGELAAPIRRGKICHITAYRHVGDWDNIHNVIFQMRHKFWGQDPEKQLWQLVMQESGREIPAAFSIYQMGTADRNEYFYRINGTRIEYIGGNYYRP